MSAPLPSWHKQTPTGWTDDRLMNAYDAIHGVWADHVMDDDDLPELRSLLKAVERADDELRRIINGRVS